MDHERTSPLERSPELAPSCIDTRGNRQTPQRLVKPSRNVPLVNIFDRVATHRINELISGEKNDDGPLPHVQ
jgi:hypothetical protein